jgi:ApbE superfamily uncharacterized protein (UPF0280 family)
METPPKRLYKTFVHKEAVFRIHCNQHEIVVSELVRQRRNLEEYIEQHADFLHSLKPVQTVAKAPEIARRMAAAAEKIGVGPMAAVAGAMAQMGVEAALTAGDNEAIIDNGGDIFLKLSAPAVIGIYSGPLEALNRLAFSLQPQDCPLSICSSSGKMGHSLSMGDCDLAVTVSKDGALADAAATLAGNLVKKIEDIEAALNKIMEINGIDGVLIIQNGKIGLAGKLPPLIKTTASPHPFYA